MLLSRRAALAAGGLGLLVPRLAGAAGETAVTPDRIKTHLPKLDRVVRQMLKETGVPGLSIAIVHRNQVVHVEGYGVRKAGTLEPVNADTVFQLASVSKPIASTVVAAVVGDGSVTWDDRIVQHDPAFAMNTPWVTHEITLRDMFCHRSGLPDHAGDTLEDIGYDRKEILHRLRYVRPKSSFRSHYAYTNFGLTAAAEAAAMASGKSWEDLSVERLYRPLGMMNTSSRFRDFAASTNRAVGHIKQGNAWVAKYARDPDAQSAAGGASSSARDMTQWLRLQIGRGTVDGREIVKAAALDETHRPQIASMPAGNPMIDHSSFYGLGWGVSYDERGRIRWSHSGGFNLGAATCVNVMPAEQIGIVVLTNTSPIGVPEAICRIFLDLALDGRVEKDWFALFGGAMASAMAPDYGTTVDYSKKPNQPTAALAANAYVGAYRSELYGPIAVAQAGSGLVMKLGPKQQPYPLRHFDRDVFTYQPTGENAFGPSAVTFQGGVSGNATSVTIENLDTFGQGTFDRAPR
jgi:CubicO group peptidase (beta-lactamase class C family)